MVLVLCEKWSSRIPLNVDVFRPPESEKIVFTAVSVVVVVVVCEYDYIQQNYPVEFGFRTLYIGVKRKYKIVSQKFWI